MKDSKLKEETGIWILEAFKSFHNITHLLDLGHIIPFIRIIQVLSSYCIQLEVWGIGTKTSPHPDIWVWLLETLASYKLINHLALFQTQYSKRHTDRIVTINDFI